MKPNELQSWMERNGKTVTDVAAATKVHPDTVSRYLTGKHKVRPVIEDAFARLIAGTEPVTPPRSAAV